MIYFGCVFLSKKICYQTYRRRNRRKHRRFPGYGVPVVAGRGHHAVGVRDAVKKLRRQAGDWISIHASEGSWPGWLGKTMRGLMS